MQTNPIIIIIIRDFCAYLLIWLRARWEEEDKFYLCCFDAEIQMGEKVKGKKH